MSRYSILTVDLNKDVPSNQREQFNAVLKQRKWKKVPELTTLWFATWEDDTDDSAIIQTSHGWGQWLGPGLV